MASMKKKKSKFEEVDQALFGGLLPGGARLGGEKAPLQQAPTTAPPQLQTDQTAGARGNVNQVFTDPRTGRPSGITVGDKTFLGLSPDDVERVAAGELGKQGGPATQAFKEQANNQQLALQGAEAAQNIGLSPSQIANIQATEAPIDFGQALTAGFVKNAPSIISRTAAGAAGGAAAGGALGLGIGAVPGAIVGGAAGLISAVWSGVQSNIASQQKGEIAASQDVLREAETNMRKLATLASNDPAHADQYVAAYNQQLSQVHLAHSKIKLETQGNLNKYIEDGTDILSDFELFLQPGGTADIYGRQLALSLSSGVPMQFSEEDFLKQ